MAKKIGFAVGILVITFGFLVWQVFYVPYSRVIRVGDDLVYVQEVSDLNDLQKGLSGRLWLPNNCGMLFTFSTLAQHQFWMGNMRFDLDFIWIADGVVVDVTENVPAPSAGTEVKILTAKVEFDSVLEVNAGTVSSLKISVGDAVSRLP